MTRSGNQRGFTLVELLVAAALMVLLLSALGGLFISASRAYRTNDEMSDRQQGANVAAQLLSYEIGLAGYKGSDAAASGREFKSAGVEESTLEIVRGTSATASDTVTVRYYEDRLGGDPVKVAVTFSAARDSRGLFNLYRHNHVDTNRQPAVQQVRTLKVASYIERDGRESRAATKETLAALRLELTFTDGQTKQVVVGLDNPQQQPVLPNL